MSLSQMEILKSRLRDVFTSAMHFYQLLQLHTDDPDYIPLAHEFEAGLTLLDSSIGEEGVLVAGRASLIRFRDDAKDNFPLQAGLVTTLFKHLER